MKARFSIIGDSIRLHTIVQGEEVDLEMGRLNRDCTPVLPYDVSCINRAAIVRLGCPKLEQPPVSKDDLQACRTWLDTEGFVQVLHSHTIV